MLKADQGKIDGTPTALNIGDPIMFILEDLAVALALGDGSTVGKIAGTQTGEARVDGVRLAVGEDLGWCRLVVLGVFELYGDRASLRGCGVSV